MVGGGVRRSHPGAACCGALHEHAGLPARAGLPEARLLSAHTGEGVRGLLEDLWTMIPPVLAADLTQAGDDDGG